MSFNPHTAEDRAEMLEAAGISSVEEMFAPVPERVRFPELHLPRQLTEMEAAARLQELADKNIVPPPADIYLGAGSYQHYIPATVNQILSRGEFYTAYTPYQPEVAQGTLQVIYEFQSMVAELLGMEVANASMYDGATALAEGALVAVSSTRKKTQIVLSGTVHPAYREVLHTYVESGHVDVTDVAPSGSPFVMTAEDLKAQFTDQLACVVVQYPNFYGAIEDLETIADVVHAAGGLLVVATAPVPLGLIKPPGELGADVVTAEGQPLGVPQSYGGPYVGLLATRTSFIRQMPGRLAGITIDAEGKRGYVLTLQTREQHIRREKATSNICTNQGLMATAATVYMSSVGPEGFREVATACYQNAHYLADQLTNLDGFSLAFEQPFFHEFTIKCPQPAREINQRLLDAGILGGFDLGAVDPALDTYLVLCATELNTKDGIDRLIGALRG
jgi:glycine dehydrogenase subunit 1